MIYVYLPLQVFNRPKLSIAPSFQSSQAFDCPKLSIASSLWSAWRRDWQGDRREHAKKRVNRSFALVSDIAEFIKKPEDKDA